MREIRLPHHPSLLRVLAVMRLLESARAPWPLERLADYFGVSQRTIRRDVETLRAAGAEIDTDNDDGGRVRFHALQWPTDQPHRRTA